MTQLLFVSEFTVPMPLPAAAELQLAALIAAPARRTEHPFDADVELIKLVSAECEAGFTTPAADNEHGHEGFPFADPAKFDFAGDDGIGAQGHEQDSLSVDGTPMMAEPGAAGNAGSTPEGPAQ